MAGLMNKLGLSGNQQSRELAEIERVEQNMAQVEAEIQQKLTQLGQFFYRDNLDNESLDKNYREIIETINKLNENRKGFYAHKLRLEGNMMCVNCGEIIPYGSVYCSHCGKRADVKEEETVEETIEESKVCVNCGAKLPYSSVYCSQCGKHADVQEDDTQ